MRYFVVLIFLSFLVINKVNAFLPSESEISIDINDLKNKKNSSVKNYKTINQEQSKKEVRENKRELKKAFRKAMFEQWKKNTLHKKDSPEKTVTDSKKPSIISVIALISGIVFFSILLGAIIFGAAGGFAGIGVLAGIAGLITGITGLVTNDKEKHNTRKTNFYSIIGLASGIVMLAIFALVLIALASFGI